MWNNVTTDRSMYSIWYDRVFCHSTILAYEDGNTITLFGRLWDVSLYFESAFEIIGLNYYQGWIQSYKRRNYIGTNKTVICWCSENRFKKGGIKELALRYDWYRLFVCFK